MYVCMDDMAFPLPLSLLSELPTPCPPPPPLFYIGRYPCKQVSLLRSFRDSLFVVFLLVLIFISP